jgi:dihydroorotase-like cyclic amidohydrolase
MFEISGGRLLSADGRFTRQNILFDDTGIQAIGVSAIPRVRRIDAGDLLILPGAID